MIESEEPGSKRIPKEELGKNTNVYMAYSNLSEVNIRLGDTDMPLDEAIREGTLTIPEIFAFARMDAQNGFCEETYNSVRGLTHFAYTFPECIVELAYDLYETPDGKQTLIEELCISDVASPETIHSTGYFYPDEDSKWGYFIDREDWGIAFEPADVSPTQITLNYTQQGGQQLGDLQIEDYTLFPAEDFEKLDGYLGDYLNRPETPIQLSKDTSGQITLDLPESMGALAPGEYYLRLTVTDIFEESEVHPLIVKYHNKQSYYIEFSVK